MTMFAENQTYIEAYLLQLGGMQGSSEKEAKKILALKRFLEVIAADPDKYDQLSPLNRKWRANEFLGIVRNKNVDGDSIDLLFEQLSRVAREATLRQPFLPKEPEKLFLDYYEFGKDGLNERERLNSDFLWASLPKYIAMEHLEAVTTEREKTEKAIADWHQSLKLWDEKIRGHEENLKKYHEHYNFVGLSKAFNEMFKKKVAESRVALFTMALLGVAILSPLLFPFIVFGMSQEANSTLPTISLLKINHVIPLVGLELVLIYFFRIALHNWQSLKTQALQLDLRQSLCAFVEGYAKFARDNEKQSSSLSKFESLIFSGLISEPGKLPSTYDGLDVVAKVLKEIRAKAT